MTSVMKLDPKGHLNLLIMESHLEDQSHPLTFERIWQDLCRLEMLSIKERMPFPPSFINGQNSVLILENMRMLVLW